LVRFARFHAGLAGFGALQAMVVRVFGALVVAFLTNFDALLEHMLGMVGAPGDEGGCEAADVGAVAVEANAGHHHPEVFFIEAGIGAELAGRNAAAEGIEDSLVVLAGAGGVRVHGKAGLKWKELADSSSYEEGGGAAVYNSSVRQHNSVGLAARCQIPSPDLCLSK
jgi:hypothetical protein